MPNVPLEGMSYGMTLREWMHAAGVGDAEMAEKIGGISKVTVRNLRLRQKGPSIRVVARIHEIAKGQVTPPEMEPLQDISSRAALAARVIVETAA